MINYLVDNSSSQKNEVKKEIQEELKQQNNNIEQNIEQKNNEVKKEQDNNLKDIRVGNTLYNPQKAIIADIRNNWKKINELAFDEELGNISRILSSDVLPVAASDSNVVLISKMIGIANQINSELDITEKIIEKSFGAKYKIICLSKEEWDKYTLEYKNDKTKFKYQEEEKKEKKNTLKEKAKELFD
jgi:hypothetical protein